MQFYKTILAVTLTSLLIAGCNSGTEIENPNELPQEFIDQQQTIIDAQKEILKDDSENVDALVELGFRYQMLDQDKKAIKAYKDALEILPEHFVALNNLADIYETQEEYELAAETIKKLYSIHQTNIEVTRDTVRILLANDEPELAIQAVENFAKQVDTEGRPDLDTFISNLFTQIKNYEEKHNN